MQCPVTLSSKLYHCVIIHYKLYIMLFKSVRICILVTIPVLLTSRV